MNPNGTFSIGITRYLQFPDPNEPPVAAFQLFDTHYQVHNDFRKPVDSLYRVLGIDKPSGVTKLIQKRRIPDAFKDNYPEFENTESVYLESPYRWEEIMQTLFIALVADKHFQKPYYDQLVKFFDKNKQYREIPNFVSYLHRKLVKA